MYLNEQDAMRGEIRKECERGGIHWAKAHVTLANLGMRRQYVAEWINEFESRERQETESEQRRLAQEAVNAAKLSADVSREAAVASRVSARWTMVAAIAAAIGTFVSAVSTALTAAQAMHWLK